MKLPCLDIIIPHYKEPFSLVRHLLDSINNQAGISLQKAIKVTIVNDAEKEACLQLASKVADVGYDFPIEVLCKEQNEGAGCARQYGLDHTELPYVMFCDADDVLFDCTSLNKLLNSIRLIEAKNQPWNYVWGSFYEEKLTGDRGFDLIPHDKPSMIWMHGKIWNRAFLEEHNIRFHPTLRTFEDTYFGKIVGLMAPKKWAYHCDEPVYLWKRNPNSVTAGWDHDNHSYMYWRYFDYITCTYDVLKFLYPHRKKIERWDEVFFVSLIFTYFILQLSEYNDGTEETQIRRDAIEDLFFRIVRDFGDGLESTSNKKKAHLYSATRQDCQSLFVFFIEKTSWNDFLQYIDKKYNVNSYNSFKIDNSINL